MTHLGKDSAYTLRPVAESDHDWEGPFRLVFQRSANPIVLLDDERRCVDMNPAGVELLGGNREQIVGTSALEYIPPQERPRWEQGWDTFLQAGHIVDSGPVMRPDGSQVEVSSAGTQTVVGGRRLAVLVLSPPLPPSSATPAEPTHPALTQRERQVVSLIAQGRESPEIAEQLSISPATVRAHVRNAMEKLGARTRAQLVAVALTPGQHPR